MRRLPGRGGSLVAGAAALPIGAAFALTFAPWGNAFASLAVLMLQAALVARIALRRGARSTAAPAFGFGLGWFIVGVGWLYVSMHDFGQMPAILAATAVVVLAAYLSIYSVAATVLAARVLVARGPFAFAAAFGAGIVVAEWLRGTVFTGLPWLAVGYAHTDGPLAGYAPLVGVYGTGGIAAFVAALVGVLLAGRMDARWSRRRQLIAVVAVVAVMVAGEALRRVEWSQPHGRPLDVRLVQGNVAQQMKFEPQRALEAMQDYTAAIEAAGLTRPDLVVLPETAWIMPWQSTPPDLARRVLSAVRASGATVALGLPQFTVSRRDHAGAAVERRLTNTVLAFSPDPGQPDGVRVARYDKRHLVPFGEFVPPGFRWFVDLMRIPLGDFERGSLGQPPFPVDDQRVAANVCYEDVFGEELIGALGGSEGATVLMNVTNVAWFGRSHAPGQHLQIARMRSIETARPMIRATNTGMTAAIDHRGRVLDMAEPYVRTVVAARVEGRTGLTPYARTGNWPSLVVALVVLAAALGGRAALRR